MCLLCMSYVKARRAVDAPCLCLLVAAAASNQFWPAKSCGSPSLYLWQSFLHGRTGEDSDGGRLLSPAAEAIWGCFLGWFEGDLL